MRRPLKTLCVGRFGPNAEKYVYVYEYVHVYAYVHLRVCVYVCIYLARSFGIYQHGANSHFFGVSQVVHSTKTSVPWGGGGVNFLKSVKKAVSEMYGLGRGVGGHIFEHRAANWKIHTKHALYISNKLTPSGRHWCRLFQAGLGTHWGRSHHAYSWAHISSASANPTACGSSLVPSLSSEAFPKAVASAADRIWCSLWLHAGCCEPAEQGLLAWLADVHRLTCTHFASPECAVLRTRGFCAASGEATARCVNLYADMVAAC